MIFAINSEPGSVRVHLTDPDDESCQRIQSILQATHDLQLGSISSGLDDTLQALRARKPHIVLLNLSLPGRTSSQLTREVLHEFPDIGVVVLTLHDEKQCLLEYLNWGARGFVLKPVVTTTMLKAVREVFRGGRYVDPLLPHCLVSKYLEHPNIPRAVDATKIEVLTLREREVCRYLASGYTNAEVADVLRISKRTVETHRAAIMSKVGVKSRAQLVHFAIEQGLWPEPGVEQAPDVVHLSVTPGE